MKNKLRIGPLTKLVHIGTLVVITIFYQYSCDFFFFLNLCIIHSD